MLTIYYGTFSYGWMYAFRTFDEHNTAVKIMILSCHGEIMNVSILNETIYLCRKIMALKLPRRVTYTS